MILKCTECGTSFNFEDSLLKEGGSKVRCSQCQSVFVAYPQGEGASSGGSVEDAQSDILGDLDLEGMEGLLDLDDEPDEDEGDSETSDAMEFELDLDSDNDEISEVGSDFEMEETEDLDMSDMDDLFNLDGDSDDEGVDAGSSDEGDVDLDFGLDDEDSSEAVVAESDSEGSQTMELDLDEMENLLDMDDQSEEEEVASDTSDEGDFDLSSKENEFNFDDEDAEEETPAVADLDDTDFDLDFQEEDTSDGSGSDFDMTMDLDIDEDETDESMVLDDAETTDEITLDGFEDMVEEEQSEDSVASDDLDFGSDDILGVEDESEALSGEGAIVEDDDMTISLDSDADFLEEGDGMDDLESTDELDLSGLEDDLLEDELSTTEEAPSLDSDDSDFSLDLDLEENQAVEPTLAVADNEVADLDLSDDNEIADLDLSDIDEVVEVEEEAEILDDLDIEPVSDGEEDTALDLDLSDAEGGAGTDGVADEFDTVEELDLSDMDDMIDVEENQMVAGESGEGSDDFDLDLDLTGEEMIEEASKGTALDDTGEFELSDLETMIEGDGVSSPEDNTELDSAGASELDLVVDFNDTVEDDIGGDLADSDDVELEFAVDDDSSLEFDDIEAIEEEPDVEEVDEFEDTFDMGTLSDDSENVEAEEIEEVYDVDDSGVVVTKKRSFIKSFAVFLILVGGGGYVIYTYFWNDLKPMVASIPYVGDFIKPAVKDDGNLNIAIIERTVDGQYIENSKSGTLFVIKGQIKNNYDHPRNFITVTGKIISKDRKKFKAKTVYAGNVLNEADLEKLDVVDIEKRLENRFGDNRSNLRIKKGKVIPFMIVFSKLPNDLDEMTVQVAGSTKTRS